MDYKKEFKAARSENDWAKADTIWKLLLHEAEIEEISSDTTGAESGKAIALKHNSQRSAVLPSGKKI